MKRNIIVSVLSGFFGSALLLILFSAAGSVGAQSANVRSARSVSRTNEVNAATLLTSTFTYQGQLKNGDNAVNESCQMVFRLYDDPAAGGLIGSPITTTMHVTNGLFTVGLDFGAAFNGNARWLDMQVRCPSESGAFTQLSPRQQLTPVPYALFSAAPWVTSGSNLTYNAGNVGIGTTTPAHHLSILGGPSWTSNNWSGALELSNGSALGWQANSGGQRFGLGQSSGGLYFFRTASNPGTTVSPAIYDMVIDDGGNVRIGSVFIDAAWGNMFPAADNMSSLGTPAQRWTAVYATNGTIQISDARLKKAVTNLDYGLSQVLQLRPVTFQWKDRNDGRRYLGLIAQEVEMIIPEALERDKDPATPLGMNYTSLVPVLIKAVQEQQTAITTKAAAVAALQIETATLREQNAALKVRVAAIEQALSGQTQPQSPASHDVVLFGALVAVVGIVAGRRMNFGGRS